VPEPPADPGTLVIQLREWKSMTPAYERAELPEFTLYGGGRVIAAGHWDGSVYRAREYTLSPDRYRQIYRLAHAAGLARSVHLDDPVPATDGSLLVASLWVAGRLHTSTLVSPHETDTGGRGRIVEFRRTVQLLALPTDPARAADYRPAGPDTEALGRGAPLTTRWRSGGQAITVAVRPLLPDEYDCADLDPRTP
jgi:hypothetical protein